MRPALHAEADRAAVDAEIDEPSRRSVCACALARRLRAPIRAPRRRRRGGIFYVPSHDIVKDVRGSKSNCEQDSRKM